MTFSVGTINKINETLSDYMILKRPYISITT